MTPLAYDPATGSLLYSPDTGQLARSCAPEPAPDTCPDGLDDDYLMECTFEARGGVGQCDGSITCAYDVSVVLSRQGTQCIWRYYDTVLPTPCTPGPLGQMSMDWAMSLYVGPPSGWAVGVYTVDMHSTPRRTTGGTPVGTYADSPWSACINPWGTDVWQQARLTNVRVSRIGTAPTSSGGGFSATSAPIETDSRVAICRACEVNGSCPNRQCCGGSGLDGPCPLGRW